GYYLRRDRFDRELEAEIRFHLEMKTSARIDAGTPAQEARRATRRQFGNAILLRERSREMWSFRWIDELAQDFRYSVRTIRKTPVLATVVVLSLALAIGANTAVFSLVDAILLKMLPVKNPGELVVLGWNCGPNGPAHSLNGSMTTNPSTGLTESTSFSLLQFELMSGEDQTLSDLFASAPLGELDVASDGQAEIASGQIVSGGYFNGLGVRPLIGRVLDQNDDRPAAEPVAVISYNYWKRRFGLARDALGKSVYINAVPFTVVGVTPPGFNGAMGTGFSPDLTIAIATDAQVMHGPGAREPWAWWLRIMGRLRPGATIDHTRLNLEGAFQRGALEGHQEYVAKNPRHAGPASTPALTAVSGSHGLDDFRSIYSRQLTVLLIIVAFVLLIACANTA